MTEPTKSERLYHLLAEIAAETEHPLTYGHVAVLIDHPRWYLANLLGRVARICAEKGEPNLTSMVISDLTGECLPRYGGTDPGAERQRCFEFHVERKRRQPSGWRGTAVQVVV